jgi:hypothetical protein
MKIEFVVGQTEKHDVQFKWGQLFGTSGVQVDGKRVLRGQAIILHELEILSQKYKYFYEIFKQREIPWQQIRSWDLEVGESEKHHVRIEKERPPLLAGIRAHKFRVYVDGELVLERRGF